MHIVHKFFHANTNTNLGTSRFFRYPHIGSLSLAVHFSRYPADLWGRWVRCEGKDKFPKSLKYPRIKYHDISCHSWVGCNNVANRRFVFITPSYSCFEHRVMNIPSVVIQMPVEADRNPRSWSNGWIPRGLRLELGWLDWHFVCR